MKKLFVALLFFTLMICGWNVLPAFANLQAVPNADLPSGQRDIFNTDLFTGSASYSYPIRVPKGTNDLTPTVSLSYDHLGANDTSQYTGDGWEVNADYVQRDVRGTPGDTSDDRYKLHFQGTTYDLIYNPTDALFHTKIDAHLKIRQYLNGGQGTTGMYWQVTTPDGTMYRFGYAANSELVCNGQSYDGYWYLDQVVDTHNNHIYYSYLQSSGVSYPSQITYNNDLQREVDFSYTPNPYQRQMYVQGCSVTETNRLSSVIVKAQGSLVHEYDVAFTQGLNGQNLLSMITEKGSNGSALPASTFSYYPEIHSFNSSYTLWSNSPVPALSNSNVMVLDVNGDGLADVVVSNWNGSADVWQVYLNNGTSLSASPQTWLQANLGVEINNSSVKVIDVNGDGLPDIVQSSNGTWKVLVNSGSSWSTSWQTWLSNMTGTDTSSTNVKIIDVNGDGLPDIVQSVNSTWKILFNTGSSWSTSWQTWFSYSGIGVDANYVSLIDANGDGLPDIVWSSAGVTWKVFFNTGSSWLTTPQTWLDNASGVDLSYNNIAVIDLNGDGLPDILRTDSGSIWRVYLNTGIGWNVNPELWFNVDLGSGLQYSNIRIADVNGDGLPDIVYGDYNGQYIHAYLNNGHAPNLLSTITTEQGASNHFDYGASTAYANTALPFNTWVVKTMTTTNGLTNSQATTSTTNYSYKRGFYSWQNKEFRGFGEVDVTNPNNSITQNTFAQDDALKGNLTKTYTFDAQNNPFTETDNTFTNSLLNNIYSVNLIKAQNYTYDGVASNPKITETDYQYDSYGNPTKISELGDVNTTGDERYTYNEYATNPEVWIVNKLSHTYLLASDDSTKVSEQWEYYDGATPSATLTPTPTSVPTPTPTPTPPMFGDGSDGDIIISTNTIENPIDSSVSGTAGSNIVTVSSGLNLSQNQLILLHQTQGTNAGVWELVRVGSYSGTNLTFTSALTNSYSSSGGNHAQMHVIPQYHNVTINSGVTWSAKPWNGTTGGILAFLANGTVTVNGTINAAGVTGGIGAPSTQVVGGGFRGGISKASTGNQVGGQAYTGESILGNQVSQNAAYSTGGGGGTAGSGQGNSQAGGGGGSHVASGATGMAHNGAIGGVGASTIVGTSDLTNMVFGGAGGGGATDGTGFTGGGGNSGGAIFMLSPTVSINGNITINGGNGGGTGNDAYAGGGGGTGGSGLIEGDTLSLGTNLVTATGGVGGIANASGTNIPGGNGSDGRIHLNYITSTSGTTSPVATTNQVTAFSLPPLASTSSTTPVTVFGNGQDGDITVALNTTATPVSSSVTAAYGATTATVGSGLQFSAGQLVMLHQTQGINAGAWELAYVQSYSGTTLTFTTPLTHTYTSSNGNHAQVLVVPQYHNVTVNSGVTWTSNAWNGTTGGIFAFVATGTVTNNGTITETGEGFRGGSAVPAPGAVYQGEGTGGPSVQSTSADGNGGGGGANRCGGGSGGNANNGVYGSQGNAGGGVGSPGGVAGTADLSTMVFGGGGGGGGSWSTTATDVRGGAGGNSGGIIFFTGKDIAIANSVTAVGQNGLNAVGSDGGGGGAGAGGSILIKGETVSVGTNLLTANGGATGGTADGTGIGGAPGSDGRIHITYNSLYTGTTNPPADTYQDSSLVAPVIPPPAPNTLTKGDLTTEIKWRNTGGTNPVTTYTYDQYGNQTSVTDDNTHTAQYIYGIHDLTNTYPDHVINAKNQTTDTVTDLGTGNLLSKTDPNGYTTSYIYDGFGRPSSEIDPYDSSSYPTISYAYFDSSVPQGKLVSKRTTAGSSNTYNTYTFTDGLGRTVQTRSDAQDTTKQIVTDVFYNNMGLVGSQTIPHIDSLSSTYVTPLIGTKTIASTYDAIGRLKVLTNPDLTQKKTTYDHFVKTLTDENTHSVTQVSNAYGKIIEVDENNGGSLPFTTLYTYDSKDQLTKITDNSSNNTMFTYDSLGNKITQVDPDMGTWQYTYDGVGNLINQTDNRTITTTRTYDELNRITKLHHPTDADILYTYDTNTIGTLTNKTDHLGTAVYTYDQRLRKTQESRTIDGSTWSTGYTYDSADRLIAQTNNDGEILTYSYNPQGTVSALNGVVSNIDYNAQGNVLDKTFANSLTSLFTYDPNSFRLTRIKTGPFQDILYTYDNVGNVKTMKDNTTNVTQTFSYDYENRLTSASASDGSYNYSYVYDPIGNLIQFTNSLNSVTYSYGQQAGPHALTATSDPVSVTPTPTPSPTPTPAGPFGDGHDGDIVISSNTTDSPIDSPVSATGGTTTATVGSGLGFAANQVVLFHQTQGVNAGVWEFAKITGYSGTTLTLSASITNSYSGQAQVRVVPQYHNVTVTSGVTWTAKSWNGTTGGILAFLADGIVTINGNLSAAGSANAAGSIGGGFRGGGGNNLQRQGTQAEGTIGNAMVLTTSNQGNGGGGGTYTGGGSGGGNATAGIATSGSNAGVAAGFANLSTMVLGGGGGAGGYNGGQNGNGGSGGNGGGIIVVHGETINIAGTITVNGKNGQSAGSTDGTAGGGGGGGAGGSILLQGESVDVGNNLVIAQGAAGAGGVNGGSSGGAGANGRIHVEYSNSLVGTTNPPADIFQFVAPSASLSISPTAGSAPLFVTADASTSTAGSNPISSYTFDFGDGTTVGPQSYPYASHTYRTAGTYTVTVTVTDQIGLTSTATQSVVVASPPVAHLNVTPSTGVVPVSVTADASTSTAGINPISTYTFAFGDGSVVGPQASSSATHAYTTAGNYSVTVTVTDTTGLTSTTSQTVTATNPLAPTANMVVSPTSGVVPVVVTANASSSAPGSNPIVSYTFNFGDGTTVGPQASSSASHTYSTVGTFTITLTVTDSINLTGTTTQSVTTNPAPPIAALSVSPTTGTVPIIATASAAGSTQGTNPISSYTFNFGDGSPLATQSGATLAHTYSTAGTYTVTVTVKDTANLTSSASQSVTFSPILSITNVSSGTPGQTTATITWTTSAGGTSQVIYGTTSGNLTSSTTLNSNLVTSHSVGLTGLTKNKTYYYKVLSKNAAGTQYSSAQFSFSTSH